MHFGQFDHAHGIDLFGPAPIDRSFDDTGELLRDEQGDEEANDTGARFEPAENEGEQYDEDEKRFPNLRVTHHRHEQIEGRIRPLLVDQMKNCLIHVRQLEDSRVNF